MFVSVRNLAQELATSFLGLLFAERNPGNEVAEIRFCAKINTRKNVLFLKRIYKYTSDNSNTHGTRHFFEGVKSNYFIIF